MTPPAAATVHAPTRRRTPARPAPPRRRSGAAAPSQRRPNARTAPRGRAAAAESGGIALLDRLLRGPVYIALVFVLLAGIVFFNVDLLKMNHGIAKTDARAGQLKRENAVLTLELARLGSSERIQRVALERGLVLPQPGDVQYLRADRKDAGLALRVMTTPDPVTATAPAPVPVSQVSAPSATTQAAPATTTQTTQPAPSPQPAATVQQTPAPAAVQAPQPTQPAATQATPTGGAAPAG